MNKHSFGLEPYEHPTRKSLLDAIAADVESARLARARGQLALAKSIDEQVTCGRSALRRMTEMQERRTANSTTGESGLIRVAEYSFVSTRVAS